jgi:peptidylprolyl isomerase
LREPLANAKEIILETVENGKYISLEYTGTLSNGEIFDSSVGRKPLEILMGSGQLIAGFESQLMGMVLNEKKVFTLAPDDAYGQKDDRLMQSVPRSEVPSDMNIQVGMVVGFIAPDGHRVPARIVELDDAQLTVDLNHPLAGQSLTFEIEVIGINDEPTQEIGTGCSGDCESDGCDCSGGNCE